MPRLDQIAEKVRSKNAGPFWLTIDIFCGSKPAYERITQGLSTLSVAQALAENTQNLRRFDIPDLHVVKFSLPRPVVQGDPADRDMHGAAWGALIGELTVP